MMQLTITIGENTIYRNVSLTDGQVSDNIQETVQDMVDTLLNSEEKF